MPLLEMAAPNTYKEWYKLLEEQCLKRHYIQLNIPSVDYWVDLYYSTADVEEAIAVARHEGHLCLKKK